MTDIGDKVENNRGLNWREPAPKFHTKTYDKFTQTGEAGGAPVFTREDVFKSPKLNAEYYEDIMLYINDIEESLTTITTLTTWFAYRKIGKNAELPEGAILASNAGPKNEQLIKIPLDLIAEPKKGLKFYNADFNFVNNIRDLRDAWSRLATDGCYLLGGLATGTWPFNPFTMDNAAFMEDVDKPPVLAIPFDEGDSKSVGHVQAEFVGNLRQQSWVGYINNAGEFERQEIFTADKDKSREAQFKITRFVDETGELKTLNLATILEVPGQYRQDNTVYDQSFNYIYAVEKDGTIHAITKTTTPNVKIDGIQEGVMSRAFIPPRPYDNAFDPSEFGLVYDTIASIPELGFAFPPTAIGDNTDKIYNYHIPMQIVQSKKVDFGTVTGGSYAASNGARMEGLIINPSGGLNQQGGRPVINVVTQDIKSTVTPGGAILCNGTNQLLYTTLGFIEFVDLDIPYTAPATSEEKIAAEEKSFINQSESTLETLKTFQTAVRDMRTGVDVALEIYDICQYIGPAIWLDKPRGRFKNTAYAFNVSGGKDLDEQAGAQQASVVDGARATRQDEGLTRTANNGSLMLMATNKGMILGVFSDAELFDTGVASSLTYSATIPIGGSTENVSFGNKFEYRVVLVCDPSKILIPGDFRGIAPFQGATIDDIYKISLTDADGNVKVYQLEVEDFNVSEIQSYLTGWWESLAKHNPVNLQTTLGFADGFDFSPGPSISQGEVDSNVSIGVNARKIYHAQFFDDFNEADYTLANGKKNFIPIIANFRGVLHQDLSPYGSFTSNDNQGQAVQLGQLGSFVDAGGFVNDVTKAFWDGVAVGFGFVSAYGAGVFDEDGLFNHTGHMRQFGNPGGGINSQVIEASEVLIVRENQLPAGGVINRNGQWSNAIFNYANGNQPWQVVSHTTSGVILNPRLSTLGNTGYGRDNFVDNLMIINNNYTENDGLLATPLTFIEFLDELAPNNFVSHPYTRDAIPAKPTWNFVWNQVHDFKPLSGAHAICEPNSNGYFIEVPVKVRPSWGTFPQVFEQAFAKSYWLNKTSPKAVQAYTSENNAPAAPIAGLHNPPHHNDVITIGRKADDASLRIQSEAILNADSEELDAIQAEIDALNDELDPLNDELDALNTELFALQDDLIQLEGELLDLIFGGGTQDQIDAKQAEIDAKEEEITAKEAEITPIEEDIAEIEAEITILESDLAAAQATLLEAAAADSEAQHEALEIDESTGFYRFNGGYITNSMCRATMEIAHRLTKDACTTVRDTNAHWNPFVRRIYYGLQQFDQPAEIDSKFDVDATIGASYILNVDEELEIEHTGFGPVQWFIAKDTLGRTIDAKNNDVNFLGKNFAIDIRKDCVGLIDPDDENKKIKSTLVTSGTKVILKGLRAGRDRFVYAVDLMGHKVFSMEIFVRGDVCYIARTRDFNIETDAFALVTSQNTDGERKKYPASKTKPVKFKIKKGEILTVSVITDNCTNLPNGTNKAPIVNISEDDAGVISAGAGVSVLQQFVDDRYLTGGTPLVTTFNIIGLEVGTATFRVSTDANNFDIEETGRDFDKVTITVTEA